jgi:hypothetical protein
MTDPVYVADSVMAFLTNHEGWGGIGWGLRVNVEVEGETLGYCLAWLKAGDKDTILAGTDSTAEVNTILAVELFMLDVDALVPDRPLRDQCLHRIIAFEGGRAMDVLQAAMVLR